MDDLLIEMAMRRDYHRIAEALRSKNYLIAISLALDVDDCRELFHL